MKSILNRLIYGIEGYSETPEIIITKFEQNPANPKRYFLEVEDMSEAKISEGAENETN